MRLGVVADVHGNLPALTAVVGRLEAEGVDRFVCAGDLVGYGPFPNECVDAVLALRGIVCVAGNHDLMALGRLSSDRCIRLAQETLAWTERVLSPAAREALAALPLDARVEGGLIVAHGSVGDPQEYVRSAEQTERELAKVGGAGASVLVLGHTHEPMLATPGEPPRPLPARASWSDRVLVNPGSVGQSRSRDPRATAAVLDLSARSVELLAVEYDAEATRTALRAAGLPENAHHLRPRPLRRAVGRAARAVRLR
jgi:predicted phosphodiesterase